MRFFRPSIVVALALAVVSCADDPTSPDDLGRGAFAGVNTGLLSTLISNTTGIGGDTATGVVVAAEIGASRSSGETAPNRTFLGLGLFSVGGMAKEVGAVTANGVTLPFVPNSPPAHYELETSAQTVLTAERRVQWRAGWTNGETIEAGVTLPPSFGTITLSSGPEVSIARLDAGDTVTLRWTGVVPGTRVFIYVSWRPEVFAPTLIVPPLQALAPADSGHFGFPGKYLSQLVRQTDGHLTFTLYRGEYTPAAATFDNGTKTLGAFSYIADSVRVRLIE